MSTPTSTPPAQSVAFRPRARLLKLIGAELISDDVVALTELVKNAYDADASRVQLRFEGVAEPGGTIEVIDDGHGMSPEVVLRHWMEPAGSSKIAKATKVTARGRRVLGEKGVGRFAVDKLASRLTLITRAVGSNEEVVATFDWDQFNDPDRMLDEVIHHWEVRPAREIEASGTILRLEGLRARWTERMFRRLGNRLGRLRSPFSELDAFSIEIESDDFPDYGGEIRHEILERAPYRLEIAFDGNDLITGTFNGKPINALFYRQSMLMCGPVQATLYAFDLETEALAKIGPRVEVRAWLKEWSGVSVYRDGFRLWPYGEPHDDWLRLDQRRVNNPVERLSNNQVLGFVALDSERNPELRDQTNREGLINNKAFTDLRTLMHFFFQVLEFHRQQLRHPNNARVRRVVRPADVPTSDALAAEFDKLTRKAGDKLADEVDRLGRRVIEDRDQLARNLRTLEQQYAELAAFGHTSSDAAANLNALIREVDVARRDLVGIVGSKTDGAVKDTLKALANAVERLTEHAHRLTPPAAGIGSRRRAIDLSQEAQAAADLMRPFLEQRGFDRLELELPVDRLVRTEMRPEVFHRLLHILAMNTAEWVDRERKPSVKLSIEVLNEDSCRLTFSDNGQGIAESIAERVFEPGFTWKEVGRGMGLTIARSLVELHGGTIAVGRDGRRKGADIVLELPLKKARAV